MIDYVVERESGGTESQLFQIIRGLDRSSFQPSICYLWPNPRIQDHAPPCDHTVLFSQPPRWFTAPLSIIRVRNFICAGRFDIVHTFFPTSNVLGVLAAWLASVPVILSSRRDLGYWKKCHDKVLLRIVRNIATCYLANSHEVKRQTAESERIDREKIVVIHNGVDVDWSGRNVEKEAADIRCKYQVPEEALVVGVVANYQPVVKGIEYFIEAAKVVTTEIPNVRFFLVGQVERQHEKRLWHRIRQLQLDEHFVFTGSQKDVRPFLSLFHVGVLPSLSEGFSNSLLEYMAIGLPTVAYNVGGNREVIVDGQSGFLVRDRSAQALAEQIVLLLKRADLREKIGRQARDRVKSHFSMRRMIREMERLYEDLHRRNSRRSTNVTGRLSSRY